MSKILHPIRNLKISGYAGEADCIALIGDGKQFSFPYFRAPTVAEAIAKAEDFRAKVIADHEASFAKRQAAIAKQRERARASAA